MDVTAYLALATGVGVVTGWLWTKIAKKTTDQEGKNNFLIAGIVVSIWCSLGGLYICASNLEKLSQDIQNNTKTSQKTLGDMIANNRLVLSQFNLEMSRINDRIDRTLDRLTTQASAGSRDRLLVRDSELPGFLPPFVAEIAVLKIASDFVEGAIGVRMPSVYEKRRIVIDAMAGGTIEDFGADPAKDEGRFELYIVHDSGDKTYYGYLSGLSEELQEILDNGESIEGVRIEQGQEVGFSLDTSPVWFRMGIIRKGSSVMEKPLKYIRGFRYSSNFETVP